MGMGLEMKLTGIEPEKIGGIHDTAWLGFDLDLIQDGKKDIVKVTESSFDEKSGTYTVVLKLNIETTYFGKAKYKREEVDHEKVLKFKSYCSFKKIAKFFKAINPDFFPIKEVAIPEDWHAEDVIRKTLPGKKIISRQDILDASKKCIQDSMKDISS